MSVRPPRLGDPPWLRGLPAVAPLLLFAVTPLIVYPWRFVAAGLLDGGDDAFSNLPFLYHSARRLLSLDVLWTPDILLGMPMIEDPEFSALYPLKLLLLLFEPVTGVAAYVLLHYAIAQATAYAFLRGALRLSRLASIFGALAYGFSGFMLGHRGHTMFIVAGAWTPLFLYFLWRVHAGGGRRCLAGAAIAFALVPLGGAMQLTAYLLAAVAVLHVSLAVSRRSLRPLLVGLVAVAPAALAGAIQVLPAMDLASHALMAPRRDYDFATRASYHPALLPLLVIPDYGMGAEWYSACGVGVALAAVAALLARRRDPLARAWAVVAVVALALMMGRYLPGLARALHALPLATAFRIPVRHNFEFGLALAVLAALGVDAAVARGRGLPGGPWRWALAAPALLGAGYALAKLGSPGEGGDHDPSIAIFIARVTGVDLLLAIGFALVFVAIVAAARRRDRLGAVASVALLTLPLVEPATHMHRAYGRDRYPDYRGQIARAPIPGRSYARVLPTEPEHGLDSLARNAAALFPGIESLYGYPSAPPEDAAFLFGLNMHGYPDRQDDVRWSRLPAIFGVTHLVMPRAVCDPVAFGMDAAAVKAGICAPGTRAGAAVVGLDHARCLADLDRVRRSYRVRLRARRAGRGQSEVFYQMDGVAEDGSPRTQRRRFFPRDLTGDFTPREAPVDTVALPEHVVVDLRARGTASVEVRDVRLAAYRERLAEVTRLRAGPPSEGEGYRIVTGRIVLSPGAAEEPYVQRTFAWPAHVPRSGTFALEIEARAPDRPTRGRLVADLYAEPDYTPRDANVFVQARWLGDDLQVFRETFHLPAVPRRVILRLYYAGGDAPVEVTRVSLLRRRPSQPLRAEPLDFADPLADVTRARAAVRRDRIVLEPGGGRAFVAMPYFLPRRPLRLRVGTPSPLDRRRPEPALEVAVRGGGAPFGPPRLLTPGDLPGADGHVFFFSVPPDASVVEIRLRSARDDVPRVTVPRVILASACRARGYRRLGPRRGGLWLYENPSALPRAYVAGELRGVESPGEARAILRSSRAFSPGRTALIEVGARFEARPLAPAVVERARFRPQGADIAVRATGGESFLVVNYRYDRRFRATIDGEPARIFRTNGLVMGVAVPAGRHVVRLRYGLPRSLAVGLGLAALGLLLALGPVPWLLRRVRGP